MKRTNIHFTDFQRIAMVKISQKRDTVPAEEYREAVDAHIAKHLPVKQSTPKTKRK